MKKMIKQTLLCAALLAAGTFAFAVEFGGVINNNSALKTNNSQQFKFDQTDTASLWLKAPIVSNAENKAYFTTQGTYSFERDFDTAKTIQYIDLDLFKIVYNHNFYSSKLELSAGRFSTYDLSGIVFAQKGDGLNLTYKTNIAEMSVYAAYTGLLNAQTDVLLSHDLKKLSGDTEKVYDLAEKNIVGLAYVEFPSLFAGQTLAIQGIGAFSLEKDKYNRYYGTAGISGPMGTIVYYDLSSTFGFTKYAEEPMEIANLTKASVTVFPPVLDSSITLSGVYASGNQGGLKPFRAVTSGTAYNSAESPDYSGIIKAGLSASCKPVSSVVAEASADLIFNASDTTGFKGFQFAAGADWQIVSDFSVGVKYNQYNDKDNTNNNKKKLVLKASLKF